MNTEQPPFDRDCDADLESELAATDDVLHRSLAQLLAHRPIWNRGHRTTWPTV